MAVATSSICVGSRCPWVRADVGAVSTQNITLPSIGPMVLDRIESGESANIALSRVMNSLEHVSYRQVIAIDADGRTASHTGARTLGTNAVCTGEDCIAGGNLLTAESVPEEMVAGFAAEKDLHLAERLLRALERGLYGAGGEEGPIHSGALLVADDKDWPLVDLRVDWHDIDPVRGLRKLWDAYKPQMMDYVTRAINPHAAPSYGVPGDE